MGVRGDIDIVLVDIPVMKTVIMFYSFIGCHQWFINNKIHLKKGRE